MDLLLICRAESEAVVRGLIEGRRGWPLTARGQHQAERLGERLGHSLRPALLYSSPLQEAHETAERIARRLGLEVHLEPGLAEVDPGTLAGRPLAALTAEPAGLLPTTGEIFRPFPDGESFADMHIRAVGTINRLVERAGGRTVALVTHPGPIQAFWLAFLRYAIQQRDQLSLRCDPASLHHLRRDPGGRKEVVSLNDTAHLFE